MSNHSIETRMMKSQGTDLDVSAVGLGCKSLSSTAILATRDKLRAMYSTANRLPCTATCVCLHKGKPHWPLLHVRILESTCLMSDCQMGTIKCSRRHVCLLRSAPARTALHCTTPIACYIPRKVQDLSLNRHAHISCFSSSFRRSSITS